MVIKKNLNSFYLIYKFPYHNELKASLLNLFDEQFTESLEITDSYYSDNISKLDWSRNRDFSRPWVKLFQNYFFESLTEISRECGFQRIKVSELWFQQYEKDGTHGWHIHGGNFTGVYYLELPNEVPKTQIIEPYMQNKIIVPDVQEGDFLLFPSYTIHRAPLVSSNLRKTIISWNCDFKMINSNLLESFELSKSLIQNAEVE